MGGICTTCWEEEQERRPLTRYSKTPTSPKKRTSDRKSVDSTPVVEEKVSVQDFKRLTLLGEGNFGRVYQVEKLDDKVIYAMKVLSKQKLKESNQLEHTITERNVLEHVDHPFLVSLRFAFQTQDKLYMVLDFVNGGELFFHLRRDKKFSEARTKYYACEIFLALEHLHKCNVIYRDLKPENILMTREGHITLTDFGLAKQLTTNSRTHTFCGTPEYLAPEVILQKGHGQPVDWWSFGTLLYEMQVGIPPFYSRDIQEMYQRILHSDLVIPDSISVEGQDLLARLLERDPKKRLGSGRHGANEIRNHRWFRGVNWDNVLNKTIPPPYVPNVKDDYDVSYFEEEFTKRPVKDSLSGKNTLIAKEQKMFAGFTFSGDQSFKKEESDSSNPFLDENKQ